MGGVPYAPTLPLPHQITIPKIPSFPQIRTMQAKIYTQDLLNEDDMKTESQVSIAKIKGILCSSRDLLFSVACIFKFLDSEGQRARGKLTRMDTSVSFDNASNAFRRYESRELESLSDNEGMCA